MKQPVLLDVMMGDNFICQLRYNKRGFPQMVDGKVVEVHKESDLKAFVESQRPSLIGKDYHVELSNQSVFSKC
ncbi:MAG: hypothetical protein K6D91_05855 [Prevotella sp.]|nr:hypothetical protein [Prevotella sp.]